MLNSIQRLPLKTRLMIAGGFFVATTTWNYFYIQNGLKKIKAENNKTYDVNNAALEMVLEKAFKGEYDQYGDNAVEQMMNDYKFFQMSERQKKEESA